MKTVIFDLDGTISDPSRGITGAINYSLSQMGIREKPRRELPGFIGPPLTEIFGDILPGGTEKGISLFRKYYREKGYRENTLYPGIKDTLELLFREGFTLCIATGKKTDTAKMVLNYFGIAQFFHIILGCADGEAKEVILKRILNHWEMNAVMIGDRGIDFHAAASSGLPSIGVEWGFGTEEELGLATVLAGSPVELPELIKELLEER